MFEDETRICRECRRKFVFTAGEQAFYANKGFSAGPQRCKDCRGEGKHSQGTRRYRAACISCGGTAIVPFWPSPDRPVYCSDCYTRKRNGGERRRGEPKD